MIANKRLIILLISSVIFSGCQGSQPEAVGEQGTAQTQALTPEQQKRLQSQVPCKESSPPIKDKSKIKQMLLDNGKITSDMSEEEANKAVNAYIKKKQQSFKRCKSKKA